MQLCWSLPATWLLSAAIPQVFASNYLAIDLKHRLGPQNGPLRHAASLKRRGAPNGPLPFNPNEGAYYLNLTVGTPSQAITAAFDTGSSDLWVPATGSNICNAYPSDCAQFGSYNYSQSSTYQDVPNFPAFGVQYSDGSSVQGTYLTETISVFGATVHNTTMAQVTDGLSPNSVGALVGVGLAPIEAAASQDGPQYEYANLPAALLQQGQVAYNAYGVWLNDRRTANGAVVFGGIDVAKYVPPLMSMPLIANASGVVGQFSVALTGLQFFSSTGNQTLSSGLPQAVSLDTGTANDFLPPSLAGPIYQGLGAQTTNDGTYIVDCNLAQNNSGFVFQLGGSNGPVITVPLSTYIFPYYSNGQPVYLNNGDQACTLPLQEGDTSFALLGMPFLRHAYVVYDGTGMTAALAQSVMNATGTNISPIPSGTALPASLVTPVTQPANVTKSMTDPTVQPNPRTSRPATTGPPTTLPFGPTSGGFFSKSASPSIPTSSSSVLSTASSNVAPASSVTVSSATSTAAPAPVPLSSSTTTSASASTSATATAVPFGPIVVSSCTTNCQSASLISTSTGSATAAAASAILSMIASAVDANPANYDSGSTSSSDSGDDSGSSATNSTGSGSDSGAAAAPSAAAPSAAATASSGDTGSVSGSGTGDLSGDGTGSGNATDGDTSGGDGSSDAGAAPTSVAGAAPTSVAGAAPTSVAGAAPTSAGDVEGAGGGAAAAATTTAAASPSAPATGGASSLGMASWGLIGALLGIAVFLWG